MLLIFNIHKETDRVDFIDAFATFVTFAADPMPVEVVADAVQHFAGELIVLPLLCVVLQHRLTHQIFAILQSATSVLSKLFTVMQCQFLLM